MKENQYKPKKSPLNKPKGLKALILTPTRELAFQIQKHFVQVLPEKAKNEIGIMTLVGGMSKEKQTRLISYNPQILIATPGRLWEFIDSNMFDYLNSLKAIEYLVIDEADKMIEMGHFEELDKILGFVYEKQGIEGGDQEFIEKIMGKKEKNRLKTADSMVPEEIIEEIGIDIPTELPNSYFFDEKTRMIRLKPDTTPKEALNIDLSTKKTQYKSNKKLKTFLVSATLTKTFRKVSQRLQNTAKKPKKNSKKPTKKNNSTPENPKLQALIQKIRFTSLKPKIIDLSQLAFMPEKLKKLKVLSSEEDKPIHLYNFLLEKANEKSLIFVNTITVAKRLSFILRKVLTLKQAPLCLHSHQQQKQRLKKLDDFLSGKNPLIVCTDVAARGLDIPKVDNVIHYQIPRDIDTFVHRSGRTARIGCEGMVFSIIGPKELKRFEKMDEHLGEEQENWRKNIKPEVRELIEEAVRSVGEEKKVQEGKRMRDWFEKNSKATEIELDEGVKKLIGKKLEGEEKKGGMGKKNRGKIDRKKGEMRVRRNGVFLNPGMIRELAEKMGK